MALPNNQESSTSCTCGRLLILQVQVGLCLQVSKMLYKMYWSQWCADTQQLINGLPEALSQPQQVSPLAVTFERWFLELKASALFAISAWPVPYDAFTLLVRSHHMDSCIYISTGY